MKRKAKKRKGEREGSLKSARHGDEWPPSKMSSRLCDDVPRCPRLYTVNTPYHAKCQRLYESCKPSSVCIDDQRVRHWWFTSINITKQHGITVVVLEKVTLYSQSINNQSILIFLFKIFFFSFLPQSSHIWCEHKELVIAIRSHNLF